MLKTRVEEDNLAMHRRQRTVVLSAAVGLMLALCSWGAVLPQALPKAVKTAPAEARLDLNQATREELLKLPGITSTWAGRILRFRPYRTKLDLLEQGVLPPPVYNRIKDYVIVHREKR